MRTLFFALPAALALLLCGCQSPADTAVDAQEWEKTQQIEVIPAGETDAIETITSQQQIEDFVQALDTSDWRPQPLPDNARPIGSFELYQTPTRHLGETEPDETLYHAATVTLYDGNCLTADIAGASVAFSLPEEAAGSLAAYFS